MNELKITITKPQKLFIDSVAFITLFGGAAGGGKSGGLFRKYFLRCMKYPGYKALILRRTFPELERSLIRLSLEFIPKTLGKYNGSKHLWEFNNGSFLEFGYCENEKDVAKYQSAEYDAIGFDESTHFTEYQITYMFSRVRGINDFPKGIDLATNPGNIGHQWHKTNIVDKCIPLQLSKVTIGSREYSCLYIPAKAKDNKFLMDSDPGYIERLDALPETEQRQLRDGDWDVYEGQYYPEFKRSIHVVEPFEIPSWWKRFRAMDYGLDKLAVPWFAVDNEGNLFIYRELYESGLGLIDAAKKIIDMTPEWETISYTTASPDLWKKIRIDVKPGYHEAEIMRQAGLKGLQQADNSRIPGWRNLREYLKPYPLLDRETGKPLESEDGKPIMTARLKIFNHCLETIRTLPALLHDPNNPEDAWDQPHEVTHMPEAIRYGCMSRPAKAVPEDELKKRRRRLREESEPVVSSVTGW